MLIAVWPNDDYCFAEDIQEFMEDAGLSDDYVLVEVSNDIDEYMIPDFVFQYNSNLIY